jgi:signal peptidase II
MSKKAIAVATIILSLIIDQASKIWVKLTMKSGDEFLYIGNWARIHFVENEGMAFGMSFGAGIGKFLLTLFRIIAVAFITYYLAQQIKDKKSSKGFVFALSLILVGAVGNIIDSIFYGQFFSHSEGSGGYIISCRWWLCQLVSRKSGGHVLFSYLQRNTSKLDSIFRWQIF